MSKTFDIATAADIIPVPSQALPAMLRACREEGLTLRW